MLELRQQYPLADLLKVAGLARSTFYYEQKALQMADKYAELKVKIRTLFDQHKGRYGYRRITAAIRRDGHLINHKTVRQLMVQLQLKSCVRVKKYRAYRGQIGHVAPNVLERRFEAGRPNEKWGTDVTEFKVGGQKLYLSPKWTPRPQEFQRDSRWDDRALTAIALRPRKRGSATKGRPQSSGDQKRSAHCLRDEHQRSMQATAQISPRSSIC